MQLLAIWKLCDTLWKSSEEHFQMCDSSPRYCKNAGESGEVAVETINPVYDWKDKDLSRKRTFSYHGTQIKEQTKNELPQKQSAYETLERATEDGPEEGNTPCLHSAGIRYECEKLPSFIVISHLKCFTQTRFISNPIHGVENGDFMLRTMHNPNH